MAQVAFEQLTNEWTDIGAFFSVDENETYSIQNRGADVLLAVESVEKPTELNGTLIKPYEVAKYKKNGGTLWLRAYNSNCSVNITDSQTQQKNPVWLDITDNLTGQEHNEGEPYFFEKNVDDWIAHLTISVDEEEWIPVFEFYAESPEGAQMDNVSLWYNVYDEDGKQVATQDVTKMIFSLVSENAYDWEIGGDDWSTGYIGETSIEQDVETALYSLVNSNLSYSGESFNGSVKIFMKVQP